MSSKEESYLNRAHEAPPAFVSRIIPSSGLKRRSKSVTDLRMITDKPLIDFAALRLAQQNKKAQSCKKPENKPSALSKNTPPHGPHKLPNTVGNAGIPGAKPPLTGTKCGDGQPKPKMAKKFPDWDYKGRFNQLNEKYAMAQETLKKMKLKISGVSY